MKSLKISIIIALLAIAFGSISMSIVMRDVSQTLKDKDQKINSLIDEVGELKQENFEFYQENTIEKKEDEQKVQSQLFSAANTVETNTVNKNINILLLGNHDGLTDTILVASINTEKKTISLISIPRDLYVSGRKINELYHAYGAEKLKEQVGEITGLSISKYTEINMEGFEQLVDYLGGIDIYVEKAIRDYTYPTDKKGYELYSVDAGQQHLDGSSALQYTRSRHSTNDFDRARRQHDVIYALKSKIIGRNFLTHVKDIISFYEIIKKNMNTDIDIFEGLGYLKDFQSYTWKIGTVLSPENYLYATATEKGAYILLPKKKDFSEVKNYIKELTEQ